MAYSYSPTDIPVYSGYQPTVHPDLRLFEWDGAGDLTRLQRAMQRLTDPNNVNHRAFAELFADGSIAAYANYCGGYSEFPVGYESFRRVVDIQAGEWVVIGQAGNAYNKLLHLSDSHVQNFVTLTGTL